MSHPMSTSDVKVVIISRMYSENEIFGVYGWLLGKKGKDILIKVDNGLH